METTTEDRIKIAVGALLSAADPISKLIIGAYNHKAQHSINVKALSSSKFKTEQLEACAKFLGLKTRDVNDGMIFTNKPTLADRIITKIESFFPSTCQECSQEYQVNLNETQTSQRLQCFFCLQPSHDCEPVQASIQLMKDLPSKLAGNVWICSGCFEKNNPLLSNDHRKRTASVSFENQTPTSSPALQQPANNPATINNNPQNGTPLQSIPAHAAEQETSDQTESQEHPPATEIQELTVCQRYLNNQCPHGMNGNKVINGEQCKDHHPRRCYPYCKFGTKRRIGCQKGNTCPKFHPKLCNNSLRTATCYNDKCKFVHLKSTKRERDEDEPPAQRRNNRENQSLNGRGNHQRSRPTTPAYHPLHRSRLNSTASQQPRPDIPSSGYQNNSSEVSFLVRMIQDMKNDFQKDLTTLRETICQQNIRWNPSLPPTAPSHPLHPTQGQSNPQELQMPFFQPQQGQTIPLWSQNIPQFSC